MWKCDKCGEYRFGEPGKCDCKEFTILDQDMGEDMTYFAFDAEEAAIQHAKYINEEGVLINDSVEILVNGKAYLIGAEPEIHYSARALNK